MNQHKTEWQILKEKNNGSVKPWDLLNPNEPKVEDSVKSYRLSICKECPEYIKSTHQCKKCGCIMDLKTKLLHASCPLNKW